MKDTGTIAKTSLGWEGSRVAEQMLLGLPPLRPRTCSLGDSGPRIL